MLRERNRAAAVRRALAWALALATFYLVLSLVVPSDRAAAEPFAHDGREPLAEGLAEVAVDVVHHVDPGGAVDALADATATSAPAASVVLEAAAPVALPTAPDMVPVAAPTPTETRPVPTASALTEAAVNDLPSSAILVDSVGELLGPGADAGLCLVDPALGLLDVLVLDPVLGLPAGIIGPIVDGVVEALPVAAMQPPPFPVPEILRDDGGAERALPPPFRAAHPSPLAERPGAHAAAARSADRYATPTPGLIRALGSDEAVSSAPVPRGAVGVLAALSPLALLRGSEFSSSDQDVPTGPAREHAPSPD